MYDCSNKVGESCYRLIARNGEFIYLRTQGYLEIEQENQVGSFVCRNTMVSEEEGLDLIAKMKERFVIMIREKRLTKPNHLEVDGPAQLEDAILSMIMKLPHSFESNGQELIPSSQKIDAIRASIDKSVRVIAVTARRRSDSEDDGSDGSSPRPAQLSNIANTPAGSASICKLQMLCHTKGSKDQMYRGKRMPGSRKSVCSHDEPMSPPTHQAPRSAKKMPSPVKEERVPPLPNSEYYFNQEEQTCPRYLTTNPSDGRPILRATIDNKIQDFCSNIGGFKYNENYDHPTNNNHQQRSTAHPHNHMDIPFPMAQKRTHSSRTFTVTGDSSADEPAPHASKRKLFISLNEPQLAAAEGAAAAAASGLDHQPQYDQSKSPNPQHIHEFAQVAKQLLPTYEDSGVDHMSDGGSSGIISKTHPI